MVFDIFWSWFFGGGMNRVLVYNLFFSFIAYIDIDEFTKKKWDIVHMRMISVFSFS
jgi:hypothetical protein